ncbi:uncharacterized protein MELLADRAFT_78468 [Melampsora larici-populina 98AG31]|uniref:C2H2-type domain-containing protein n=1 Tax=Melampsora larici-populina (strain 98AG31 / pathotype 3-4-7) TaxID=747676 RepID=F4RUR6_MELLP|nr:uncharacterized protein MELLADRAFT_78468 [Melampsora larici-populina 98AG31]EGG03742.1 hypothetical protein MELLADRAFT_78468 [Melampsora larici-populina 98AG31]
MSFSSHIELEKSIDLILQQFPWNDLFDLTEPQSSSSSTQVQHPNSHTLKPPPPQEYPIPSLSECQPLHSSFPNHENGDCTSTDNSLDSESWSNCLKQIFYDQSETFEKDLQNDNPNGSLGIEQPYSVPNESEAQVDASSIDQSQACSTITKRKRSDSYLSLGDSQSSTTLPTCKVFECFLDPGCSEKFSRIEHLARHERKHTKAKPFKCHCGKSFGRLDNWRQHKNSLHKSFDVENAETEKILVKVQKELQRLNKLRTPTIVSVTKEGKGPEVKKVKRSGDHQAKGKPKSHGVPLPTLTASGPYQEPPQLKVPGAELPYLDVHHFGEAQRGFGISAPTNSTLPLDFLEYVTDLTNSSFDGGPATVAFTPQGTCSTFSDFSTSPFITPININRVLPFQTAPSTSSPQFYNPQPGAFYPTSLLEPFQFISTPIPPLSFQPILQPFVNHGAMRMAYPTVENPMTRREFHHTSNPCLYSGSNLVPLVYPQYLSQNHHL